MLANLLLLIAVPCTQAGPKCMVEAIVNGRRIKLIVDTGADLTVLTKRGASRAGLRKSRRSPMIIMRGVGGTDAGWLARTKLAVGSHAEDRVLIAVSNGLDLGRADGLLGMSYLERFRTTMGARELTLTPIDKNDTKKPGGHGQAWWTLRFAKTRQRLAISAQGVKRARAHDKAIADEIGTDGSGITMEKLVERIRVFYEEELEQLTNEAGRHGVPRAWRR